MFSWENEAHFPCYPEWLRRFPLVICREMVVHQPTARRWALPRPTNRHFGCDPCARTLPVPNSRACHKVCSFWNKFKILIVVHQEFCVCFIFPCVSYVTQQLPEPLKTTFLSYHSIRFYSLFESSCPANALSDSWLLTHTLKCPQQLVRQIKPIRFITGFFTQIAVTFSNAKDMPHHTVSHEESLISHNLNVRPSAFDGHLVKICTFSFGKCCPYHGLFIWSKAKTGVLLRRKHEKWGKPQA